MLKEKYDHRHYYFFFYTVAHNNYGVFVSDKKDIISLFLRGNAEVFGLKCNNPKIYFQMTGRTKIYSKRYRTMKRY